MKKVAIITGASRGIGSATAKLLARNDYAVCINYYASEDKAHELLAEIKTYNQNAIAVKANMADEQQIIELFKQVDNDLKSPVTALINNAGITGNFGNIENITKEQLYNIFAINVFGTIFACREAISRMKKNGGGQIVNISSEAAKFGGNQLASYAASKAAINTFTIGLAREVAPFNIRVNALSLGIIDTDMHNNASPERISNLLKSIPLGRMGEPHEVAEAIHWLISDAASYISGAIIPMTGAR